MIKGFVLGFVSGIFATWGLLYYIANASAEGVETRGEV